MAVHLQRMRKIEISCEATLRRTLAVRNDACVYVTAPICAEAHSGATIIGTPASD